MDRGLEIFDRPIEEITMLTPSGMLDHSFN